MIIERLDLKAFGGFTDFSLDLSAGPHRFHIVHGANESGKSTSLRAIHSFLFGFPRSTTDNYLHPNPKMRVGGRLIDQHGSPLECIRRKGTKETLRRADDKTAIADSVMNELLGGIDGETFEHRFGLSHDELVRGGSQIIQGGGDLGSILFAAGAGVDRLREIQAELDDLCGGFFKPGGSKGTINQTTKAFKDQKKDLASKQMLPAEYQQRKESLDAKVAEIDDLQTEVKATAAELASLERLRDAMPLIPKWKSIQEQLQQVGDAPLLDDDFIQRRRSTQTMLENASQQHGELNDRLQRLKLQRDELADDSAVIVYQSQIEALFQKLGAREEARDQCKDLQKTLARLERHLREKLRDLKVDLPATDDNAAAIDEAVEKLRISDAIQARVNELALKHDTLVTQRSEAEARVDALTRRIAALEKEFAATDVAADPNSIGELIESVGKPDAWLSQLAQQQSDADRVKRNCQAIHRKLDGIEIPFQQAAQLRLPSESSIESAATRMQKAADEVATAKARQDQLTQERDEVSRRIKTEQAGQPLPTLAELDVARAKRDSLIGEFADLVRKQIAEVAQIDEIRLAIKHADQLVDAIRTHQDQVHRRSLDLAKLDELADEIAKNELTLETAMEASDGAEQEWYAIWQSIGVAADSPKRMQRWATDHSQLVESVQQWNEETSRVAEIERRIESACQRLHAATGAKQFAGAASRDSGGATLFDVDDDATIDGGDFVSLYQNATSLRRRLAEAHQQRTDLQKKLAEAKQQLPDAQSDLQAKVKLVASWQSDWKTTTQSFAHGDDTTPTVVVELVRDIEALSGQKRERDILAKRIRSIRSDEKEFAASVFQLFTSIDGDEKPDDNPHAVIRELFGRLQSERSAAAKRESLQQQITEVEARLDKANEVQAECSIVLKQLCGEASSDSPDDLIEIERRSGDRREYLRQNLETEDKLRILAAGESITDLIKRADEQDEGVLDVDIESKTRMLEELSGRLSECESERGELRLRFKEIDEGNVAAELSQSLQLLSGQLERDAKEYARLKIASMILQRSIEHYRAENQGPVLGYAQEIFRDLTCGEYKEVRVEYMGKDEPTLAGVKSADETNLVPAALMSTGTADALYLSLRLASLRHQLGHGSKIPLIVDDCLVQLDDQRTIAALKVFSKLSLDTQVILFTHHQHLVDLAAANLKADEFHSHQLST
ncbi:MAG: AAA family ATPase [Pirellulaceae bacterium]